jgi:hypothetical protein
LKIPLPSGCTTSNPTVSRYDIYKAEIAAAGNSSSVAPIIDYSGIPRGNTTNPINGENGAPLCAARSGFTPTYNATWDPRIVNVAVVNCEAQAAAGNISGGNSSANGTPVAAFAKYFLTQPYAADGTQNLYGEMTGLITGLNSTRIFNQVQLYR